ncbi:MAG: carbohydrate ABC transporter permease [Chloroflexi bacterium]|nr:carbohydrate ABC transporter permease [Chloroflexota bacterium]
MKNISLGYRFRHNTSAILLNVFLWIMALLMIIPFVWMITSAFKPVSELFVTPLTLLPKQPTLQHFVDLFAATSASAQGSSADFPRWYLNSIFVATVSTILITFFCSLAGFGFAKYEFRGKNVMFAIVIGSMTVPFIVVAIPLFILMANLKLLNSFTALILPFVAPAFGIFMMRQFIIQTLPNELLDAARIDGASEFRIYWQIVLPLIRPALGALAIFMFLLVWNNYFWPLLIMNDTANYTLPLGLASIRGENFKLENYGRVLAGSALTSAPMVVVFLVLQRQFISGLTMGAVKS